MMDSKNNKAISEVYEILCQLDKKSLQKIPSDLLENLKANAGYDVSYIKPEIPLEELDLEPETKDILAVISYECFCDDKEKEKWSKIFLENERKYKMNKK